MKIFYLQIQNGSNSWKNKLNSIKNAINYDNDENIVTHNDDLWQFLQKFHILTFDLDLNTSIIKLIIHNLTKLYGCDVSTSLWSKLFEYTTKVNALAGSISKDSIPTEIKDLLKADKRRTIPDDLNNINYDDRTDSKNLVSRQASTDG